MEHYTPTPTLSTLDILLPRPHLRLLNNTATPNRPNMAIRTAEEAELPDDCEDRDVIHLRTEGTPTGNDLPTTSRDDGLKELDILTYIPHPPLDPLHIQGWDSIRALENIDEAQRTIWNDATEAKVLAYRAYGGKIESREDILKARDLIRKLLGETTDPTVSPPAPAFNFNKRDTPPYCALIRNISPEKAQELIKKVSTIRATRPDPN